MLMNTYLRVAAQKIPFQSEVILLNVLIREISEHYRKLGCDFILMNSYLRVAAQKIPFQSEVILLSVLI